MGLVISCVDGLAFVAGHREAGNGRCVATKGISPVLDVEDSERQDWASGRPTGDSRPNSPVVRKNSLLYGINNLEYARNNVTAVRRAYCASEISPRNAR